MTKCPGILTNTIASICSTELNEGEKLCKQCQTELDKHLLETEDEFISWVKYQLIPDMKESGLEMTASDMGRLVSIIERLKLKYIEL